jgi:hypothetical protein
MHIRHKRQIGCKGHKDHKGHMPGAYFFAKSSIQKGLQIREIGP